MPIPYNLKPQKVNGIAKLSLACLQVIPKFCWNCLSSSFYDVIIRSYRFQLIFAVCFLRGLAESGRGANQSLWRRWRWYRAQLADWPAHQGESQVQIIRTIFT